MRRVDGGTPARFKRFSVSCHSLLVYTHIYTYRNIPMFVAGVFRFTSAGGWSRSVLLFPANWASSVYSYSLYTLYIYTRWCCWRVEAGITFRHFSYSMLDLTNSPLSLIALSHRAYCRQFVLVYIKNWSNARKHLMTPGVTTWVPCIYSSFYIYIYILERPDVVAFATIKLDSLVWTLRRDQYVPRVIFFFFFYFSIFLLNASCTLILLQHFFFFFSIYPHSFLIIYFYNVYISRYIIITARYIYIFVHQLYCWSENNFLSLNNKCYLYKNIYKPTNQWIFKLYFVCVYL